MHRARQIALPIPVHKTRPAARRGELPRDEGDGEERAEDLADGEDAVVMSRKVD